MTSKILVSEIIDDVTVDRKFREALLKVMKKNRLNGNALLLVKSSGNNDVNGSQHHPERICFGYHNAVREDIKRAASLGGYNYFFERGTAYDGSEPEGQYTGNQYDGHLGNSYAGIVINPPAYAIDILL